MQSPAPLEQPKQVTLKEDQQGKGRVGEALHIFNDALKVYGREPEQLESVTKLFMFGLSEYPVDKIVDALAFYAKHYEEFPTPSNIVNIIERGNKPPFEKSIYIRLSQKRNQFPDSISYSEQDYMDDYEKWSITGT